MPLFQILDARFKLSEQDYNGKIQRNLQLRKQLRLKISKDSIQNVKIPRKSSQIQNSPI